MSVSEVIAALTKARLRHARRTDMSPAALGVFSSAVYDYITEVAMWPETASQYPPDPARAVTSQQRAELLNAIENMGLPAGEHPAEMPDGAA